MPDPTKKPWEQNLTVEDAVTEKKPWERNLQTDDVKKKVGTQPTGVSTIPPQKLVSETSTGSSGGVDSKIKLFNGFSNTDLSGFKDKTAKPVINNKLVQQINPNAIKEKQLKTYLSNTKVTPENMDEVTAKTNEFSAIQKANKVKNAVIANNLLSKINNVDVNLSKQRLKDAENDNQFIDYAREFAKGVVNTASNTLNETVIKPLNIVSSTVTGQDYEKKPLLQEFDTMDKYVPLKNELLAAKKENPNSTYQEQIEIAKQKFIQNDIDKQKASKANDILSEVDPETQKIAKTSLVNSLDLKNNELKANTTEINLIDHQYEGLIDSIDDDNKKIKDYKSKGIALDQNFIDKYNEKSQNVSLLKKRYADLLNKNNALNKDVEGTNKNIELFKLNYNPFDKFIMSVGSSATKMVGGVVGLASEILPTEGLILKSKDVENFGRAMVNNADEQMKSFRRIALGDVQDVNDFGRYFLNLVAEQVPVLAAASTGAGGLAFLGAGSGGQKTLEMRKELETNPSKYSNAQVKIAGLAFGLAEAIPEIQTLNIIRGAERTIASISSNIAERELFYNGIKSNFKIALDSGKKVLSNSVKEGLSENATGIMQDYIDEKVLGQKVNNKKNKRTEEFFSGFIMGGGMIAFAEVPAFTSYVASKVSSEKEMRAVRDKLKTLSVYESELKKEGLTEEDKKTLKSSIEYTNKDIANTIKSNIQGVEKLSKIQIEELVNLTTKQSDIRLEAENVKKGNLIDEIKKIKLAELKSEFKLSEEKRNAIKNGSLNSVELLPFQELEKIKKEALKELTAEQNPDGKKDLEIDDKQILERANKNYLKQIKDAETQSAVTSETQPEAEVQEPIISEQAEVDGNYIYEGKEYIVKDGSITDIEENLLPLDFSSEESTYSKITTKGEKVVQPIPNQEAKVEVVVAPSVAEITKDEYNDFVDNNVVSEERLIGIAEKVKTQIPLTEQENAIFTGKTTEVNNIIASEGVQKGNTESNGNFPIGDNTDLQQGQVEAVQPTSNVGESKNNAEIGDEGVIEGVKPNNEGVKNPTESEQPNEKVNLGESKQKVNNNFEQERGKHSILKRLSNGENLKRETDIINNIDFNYDIRKQDIINRDAENLVDKIGVAEAYNLLKEGKIIQADMQSLVYNIILDRMPSEHDSLLEKIKDPNEYLISQEQYLQDYAEVSQSFAKLQTMFGQGNAVMNYIYNKNQNLRYELSKQIQDYKNDNKGIISKEVLAKYENADKRLKELNDEIKQSELKLKEANDNLLLKNIEESFEREKQIKSKNKAGLTINEQKRKKELSNKFFGRLNDVTSFATLVADKDFREYLGLTFKQAKGDLEYFTKKILKEIGKGAEKHLPELFKVGSEIQSEKTDVIKISEDGKITIPKSILENFIKDGVKDINEISEKILETLIKDNPNLTIRDIRDSITNYGKKISKTRYDLDIEIGRLKRIGELESKLEDLQNGIINAKTEIKKRELTEKEKSINNQISQLEKDLGITDAKKTEQAKNYTKKRIGELKTLIDEGNYAKREVKPLKEDIELRKLRAEKLQQQEIFDKERYKLFLQNRSVGTKVFEGFMNILNIKRAGLTTGEFSPMFVQGGALTVRTIIRDPKQFFRNVKQIFKSLANVDYYKNSEETIRSSDEYQIIKDSKLGIVQTDAKQSAREELFNNALVEGLFDASSDILNNIFTSGIESKFGKEKADKFHKTFETVTKDYLMLLRPIERANNNYMNNLRFNIMKDGIKMLEQQGKNPIDNLEDYKRVASAINTLSGRSNLGKLEAYKEGLGFIFFSAKLMASTWQRVNPVHYWSLRDTENWKKPSVAQKMLFVNTLTHYAFMGGITLLMKSLYNGMSDDDKEKATMEYDPRSSDFMKFKVGNLRLDYFGTTLAPFVLFSRMYTEETVTKGEVKKMGEGTTKELGNYMGQYVVNKLNPVASGVYKQLNSHKETYNGKDFREDAWGNDFNYIDYMKDVMPIIYTTGKEVIKEQPNAFGYLVMLQAFGGVNPNVYGNEDKGLKNKPDKDENGNQNTSSNSGIGIKPKKLKTFRKL